MIHRLNVLLAMILVSVLTLLMLFRVNHLRPNYQIIMGDDMTYSPAYTAYAPNTNYVNGRTLQDPVPGTLARGEQRIDYEATPQDALRAGEQISNPFQLSTDQGAAAADRGAIVFQTFCVVCHGGDGAGRGRVAARGFPPPPSLLTGKSRDMKDGQLFHILTYGQNTMPTFAAQLRPDRRWDVINYIRRLQKVTQLSAVKQRSATGSGPSLSILPNQPAPEGTAAESKP